MLLMLIHTTYILSIIISKRALLVGPWFFSLFSVIWIRECECDAECRDPEVPRLIPIQKRPLVAFAFARRLAATNAAATTAAVFARSKFIVPSLDRRCFTKSSRQIAPQGPLVISTAQGLDKANRTSL